MSFVDNIIRMPIAVDQGRASHAAAKMGPLPDPLARLIEGAAGSSPYLAFLIEKEGPGLRAEFEGMGEDLIPRLTHGFDTLSSADLGPALRRAKRQVALFAGLADLGGVWDLEQVTASLTTLADRAVDLALRAHLGDEIRRGKLPQTASDVGGIVAMAMGKMGAYELNYSSDIDLIMLFDDGAYDPDDLHQARASLIRVTRKMAATLSDNTEHGYVFRTDLRLRPDAAVTPVCLSVSAALAYYEAEGRTWERAAYIKARPCAGNLAVGQYFLAELRPFVWRRQLDFAAIQDAHDMRLRIREHKGLGGRMVIPGHDMKLGQGGIREIEFFTQTRQLIAGGRDPDLRIRATVPALIALAQKDWITQDVADELIDHYRHHREVEHRIQMINDAQTHHIPKENAGIAQVAGLMGQTDLAIWSEAVRTRLDRVESLTDAFFAPSPAREGPDLSPETQALIDRWIHYPALRSNRAKKIFKRVKPELLSRMSRAAHTDDALARFDGFLAGMPAGVQLFSLFEANPHLIDLIVDICATSPALAAYLSRHSEVLDAVLGGSFFDPWPRVEALTADLARRLDQKLAAPDGDYERALDLARIWLHEWQFRIGVHHLRGLADSLQVGKEYAALADAALRALSKVVEDEFAQRHGKPPGRGAVVMAMGSLGAGQLNAASDLDLIVIYDPDGADMSDGKRPLAVRQYYARLTQAMITALSAPTAVGRLYEVDMRLRPSGRQGPVATSLDSFRHYQLHEAWTWEHLALTRARIVTHFGASGGDLARDCEALRLQVLKERGSGASVLADLADMRSRLLAAKPPDGAWEAKIGPGRLQDIELLAQSFALRTGHPGQSTESQIRAGRRHGLIDQRDADRLASAQRFLWRLHCSSRLVTQKVLDMDAIGQGGRDFLMRETDVGSFPDLAKRLSDHVEGAAEIIDASLRVKPG